MTILVADDNEANTYQLRVLLSAHGYRVAEAANGAEALAEARRDPPALVIADILMPVMDGFSLCREWQADGQLRPIPFVFYTATYVDDRDRDLALSLGAVEFLIKPAEPEVLLATIERAMAQPARLDAPAAGPPAEAPPPDDLGYYRAYNEALVRKLEAKMEQLSEANRALVLDIAERRRAEAALLESERFSRSTIDALTELLCVVDADGAILTTNRAWREFGATQAAHLPGTPLVTNYLVACDGASGPSVAHAQALAAGVRAVIRGDQAEFALEYPYQASDQTRWFVGHAARFADAGPVRVVITHRDITLRRQAETERAALAAQVRQQQKLESIGTLAAGVAHEISNPVMAVANYVDMVEELVPAGSVAAGHLVEIRRENGRITTIVRNLLQFARQDHGDRRPTRMADAIEATASLIRAVLRYDQVALTIDVPADLPLVHCRAQQIQQVLMNLLTNARDALNEKYPQRDPDKRITLTCRTVQADGGAWLRLTVEDHGPGIADAVATRMMDPFYTTKGQGSGTGLGLSISHGIVKDHGGRLWHESEQGLWTRFHVDLPLDGEA